jgi:hypothetical protein
LNSLSTHQSAEVVGNVEFGRTSAAVFLVVALVGLSACATVDKRPAGEVVKVRAQERWDALVRGDVKAAYRYLSPGSRAVITAGDYEANIRKGFWKSAKVDKVECTTAQSCDAMAAIEYEYQGRRITSPLRETWIQEGTNWWYVQK